MRLLPDKNFIVKINTYKKPVALSVKVGTSIDNKLIISAFDEKQPNTFLFSREARPMNDKTYHFGIPKTSKSMWLLIYSAYPDYSFDVKKVDVNHISKLKTEKLIIDDKTKKYQDFIRDFCFDFSKYKVGDFIDDKDKLFLVNIVEEIADTPVRIGETTDIIQVSRRDFIDKTVSQRSVMMCHEYSHNYLNKNPDSEFEADINGLKVYLSMSYPVIEAYNTFMTLTPSVFSKARLKNVENYLNQYEKRLIFKNE